MSFSQVDICNMALGQCGVSQEIQALEFAEDAVVPNEARLCRRYWPLAFEATARAHNWGCLRKRADISGNLTTAPAWGFAYAYSLPADYLGWVQLEDPAASWLKVGRTIQTDATEVTIEYVARTEDTDLFDSLFVEALVMRLAAYLAPALAGEGAAALGDRLLKWHEQVSLPGARYADSVENSPGELSQTTWIDARQ